MVIKSFNSEIEKKFLELCQEVAKDLGLKIYDLSYVPGSQTLKVFIEDPETQTAVIEDCVKMDRSLTPFIDELDWMPEELILEISSPGMFRELNQIEHFESVLNQQIQVSLSCKFCDLFKEQVTKKLADSKKLIGLLKDCTQSFVELEVEDKMNKVIVNIDYKDIKKANLEPSLE